MTAIHYGVLLAGAVDGWYRRNRVALEYRDSMDRPFYLVERLGDREDIRPVGEFSCGRTSKTSTSTASWLV